MSAVGFVLKATFDWTARLSHITFCDAAALPSQCSAWNLKQATELSACIKWRCSLLSVSWCRPTIAESCCTRSWTDTSRYKCEWICLFYRTTFRPKQMTALYHSRPNACFWFPLLVTYTKAKWKVIFSERVIRWAVKLRWVPSGVGHTACSTGLCVSGTVSGRMVSDRMKNLQTWDLLSTGQSTDDPKVTVG